MWERSLGVVLESEVAGLGGGSGFAKQSRLRVAAAAGAVSVWLSMSTGSHTKSLQIGVFQNDVNEVPEVNDCVASRAVDRYCLPEEHVMGWLENGACSLAGRSDSLLLLWSLCLTIAQYCTSCTPGAPLIKPHPQSRIRKATQRIDSAGLSRHLQSSP